MGESANSHVLFLLEKWQKNTNKSLLNCAYLMKYNSPRKKNTYEK